MSHRTDRQKTFSPLQDKTLSNVLRHLFVSEFGYEKKVIFAEAMIERILETIEAFVRPASLLKPGQLLWMAVVNDGRKHARKSMKEIGQVPVILDLVTDDELQALADGQEYRLVRCRRHARLLEQAFAQGGVLAQSDLAAITLTSRTQASDDIARLQENEERLLPYRGSVQDLGATITHKVEVIRLLEAGYLEPEICQRLSVVHDLRSVENYVQPYKNVMKLLERGLTPGEVSDILSVSERLVETYIEIIRQYHPEVLAGNPHFREQSAPSGPCPT